MTGLHSAIGILAAVHHRDATGQGQHVETNLLSSAMSALVNQTSAYVAADVVPHRMGNAHLSLFPYEPLATSDGDLIVIAGNDSQFRKLAAALDIATVADDERFASVGARNENREVLRPILLERLATRSAKEWFDVLTAAGIPCGPINDVRGGVELATELGLEPVVLAGGVPTLRNPIRMSATPRATTSPRPAWTSTATRSAPGWACPPAPEHEQPRRRHRERTRVPNLAGHLHPRHHHPDGPGPGR